jgi:site-specific recombinase XerD
VSNSQDHVDLLLSRLSRIGTVATEDSSFKAQWEARRASAEEGNKTMNNEMIAVQPQPKAQGRRESAKVRGVYERKPGEWWIRYVDAQGRYRREKAGTKGTAIDLVRKRKTDALIGKKLPEKLRRATVTFAEIARDALDYSKANKLSYRNDACRMENLLRWFREYPADAVAPQDIERRFGKQEWSAATSNRYRALLSLTYRIAIRNGKVKENPARLVKHRLEDNSRIRFLSADEETALRKAVEAKCPDRLPEFVLALNTGMRLSEQYGLTWTDVSLARRVLTIPRSKNGSTRHVPLNQAAVRTLEELHKRTSSTGFVCGGAPGPRSWFEPALLNAKITGFTWHCIRHTFASRLVMAGVDLRTVQELLGHKTIAMTVRYSHLAPKHTLAAVERLDTPTTNSTGTTTDTAASAQPTTQAIMLQ